MAAQKDNDVPRRPGRPRGKKPGTASREQLMDIALMLFARQGSPILRSMRLRKKQA